MTNLDMAQEETEDRFYAQFDSREVELLTLDELAAAFEEGHIHGNTFVCREGESQWATLSEVAGLGDEREPEVVPPSVVERRPPMPQRAVEVVSETRPALPGQRPMMNTVPAARFATVIPSLTPVVASSPASFAPVSSNIDDRSAGLDDEQAFRPKRRWGRVLLAAAALTVAGGGVALLRGEGAHALLSSAGRSTLQGAGNESQASLGSLPSKPSESLAAAPVTAAPVVALPVPVAAVGTKASDVTAAPGLSDEMKAALLAQDRAQASKHGAKAKASAGPARGVARRAKAPSSAGFKSGGSAYDPLNGKL